MKIWITTDTHFGHKQMHAYCNRPQEFEEKILGHLIAVVKSDDIVIHLGDVCIGRDEFWNQTFNNSIPGKHWLVKGNHDRKSNGWYLSHGWDMVCGKFQDKLFGKVICFSHCPTRYVKEGDMMYISGSFDLNIHGHFHNNLHRLQEGKFVVEGEKERNEIDLKNLTERHKLLSIEETNYQPVDLEKFI